jgi:hypothetical protein
MGIPLFSYWFLLVLLSVLLDFVGLHCGGLLLLSRLLFIVSVVIIV